MQTNVNMLRRMGDFEVTQRTKDGMFNATSLTQQWNKFSGEKKEPKEFFKNQGTSKFIEALILEENLNGEKSTYLKTRGKYGGTWMHPLLFIKFAMWLNPKFEVKVLKFVHDNLIAFRHDAGDDYKMLSSSLSKYEPTVEQRKDIAKAINWIVFNKNEKDIRNSASEAELKELAEIEKKLSFAVDTGLVKNINSLIGLMRKMWADKWNN